MRLSGSGMRTVVIERIDGDRYVRYHSTCGEAVSERLFRRLGWTPASKVASVDAIRISAEGGASVDIPVKGRIVDRPSMLEEMRARCDADRVCGSVASVSVEDGGYRLALSDGGSLLCDWLIGADGARSVVRRDVLGGAPRGILNIENCIAEGDGGSVLDFEVAERFGGCYAWRFPSKPGTVSVGFATGTGSHRDVAGLVSWGARSLPFGGVPVPAGGRCILVGDAAALANPLCYGGIGVALLSGRRAAEAVLKGDSSGYLRWIRHDRMFDTRFMEARTMFASWTDEEIRDAISPLSGRCTLAKGLRAMIRRPRWSRVYMGVFLAFRMGWRCLYLFSWVVALYLQRLWSMEVGVMGGDAENVLKCSRCQYEWTPRRDSLPLRCPRCRSVKWNEQTLRLECRRCGHVWNSRDGDPKRCPACGSYRWMDEPKMYECRRCGYRWEAKSSKKPARCPSCFSRAWSDDRRDEQDPAVDTSMDARISELHGKGVGCVGISIELGIPYARVRSSVERLFPGMPVRRRRSGSSFFTLSIFLIVSMYFVCSISAAFRRSAICSWQVFASCLSLSASS